MADTWSPRREDREDWRDRDRDRDRGSRDGNKRQDRYQEERRDWDRDREPRDDYEKSRRHSKDDYIRNSKRPRDDSEHSATLKQNSPKRRLTADEFFEQRTPSLKQTNGQIRNLTWGAPKSQLLKREPLSAQSQSRGINVKTQGNISKPTTTPLPVTVEKQRHSPRIHPDREKLQSDFRTSMDRDHPITEGEQIIGNHGHSIIDHHKDPRRDSAAYSISASENVTPRSMAMDTDITSPTRLHSSEPTSTTAAPENVATVSLGPRSAELTLQTNDHGPSSLEILTRYLSNFGQTITKETVLAQRQDNIAKKFERKKLEHERWNPHHNSFSALAEEQVKDMNKTKEILAQVTEERQKHEDSRERTLQSFAKTLLSLSTGLGLPKADNEEDSEHMKAEIKQLRSEIHDMQFNLQTQNSINQSFKELAAKQHELSTQFKLFESKLASTKSLSDLESQLESKAAKLSSRTDGVSSNLESKLQSKLDKLSNKTNDLSIQTTDLNAQVAKLVEKNSFLDDLTLESDHAKLNALYAFIHGAEQDEPSLLDAIRKLGDDNAQLKSKLKGFKNDLSSLRDDQRNLSTRIASIPEASTQESHTFFDAKTALKDLLENVRDITLDIESLREDQINKDAQVDAENDQLRTGIRNAQGGVDILDKKHHEIMNDMEALRQMVGAGEEQRLEIVTNVKANFSKIQNLHSWISSTKGTPVDAPLNRAQMSQSPQFNMSNSANKFTENPTTAGITQGLPTGPHNQPSPISTQGLNNVPHPYPSPNYHVHSFRGPHFVASPTQVSTNGAVPFPSSVLPSSTQQMQPPPPTASRRQSGTLEYSWPTPAPVNCNQALGEHAHRIIRCETLISECQIAVQKLFSDDHCRRLVNMVLHAAPFLNNLTNMHTDIEELKNIVATSTNEISQLKQADKAPINVVDLSNVSEEDFEKTVNGLKEDIAQHSRELEKVMAVEGIANAVANTKLTGLIATFQKVKQEMEEQLQSLQTDVNTIYRNQSAETLRAMRESIQNLENHIGIQSFKQSGTNSEIASPEDGSIKASVKSMEEPHPVHEPIMGTFQVKIPGSIRRKRNGSEGLEDLGKMGKKKYRGD